MNNPWPYPLQPKPDINIYTNGIVHRELISFTTVEENTNNIKYYKFPEDFYLLTTDKEKRDYVLSFYPGLLSNIMPEFDPDFTWNLEWPRSHDLSLALDTSMDDDDWCVIGAHLPEYLFQELIEYHKNWSYGEMCTWTKGQLMSENLSDDGSEELFGLGDSDDLVNLDTPSIISTITVPTPATKHDYGKCKPLTWADIVNVEKSNFTSEVPTAVKFDSGKLNWSLMPFDALEDVVKVLEFGAAKYAAHNWQKGKGLGITRTLNAVFRHLFAYAKGEKIDPESGLSHIAHATCNIIFILHYLKSPEKYDQE